MINPVRPAFTTLLPTGIPPSPADNGRFVSRLNESPLIRTGANMGQALELKGLVSKFCPGEEIASALSDFTFNEFHDPSEVKKLPAPIQEWILGDRFWESATEPAKTEALQEFLKFLDRLEEGQGPAPGPIPDKLQATPPLVPSLFTANPDRVEGTVGAKGPAETNGIPAAPLESKRAAVREHLGKITSLQASALRLALTVNKTRELYATFDDPNWQLAAECFHDGNKTVSEEMVGLILEELDALFPKG